MKETTDITITVTLPQYPSIPTLTKTFEFLIGNGCNSVNALIAPVQDHVGYDPLNIATYTPKTSFVDDMIVLGSFEAL